MSSPTLYVHAVGLSWARASIVEAIWKPSEENKRSSRATTILAASPRSIIATASLTETQNSCSDMYAATDTGRSEEHTSELQSRFDLVCRLLLEQKKD